MISVLGIELAVHNYLSYYKKRDSILLVDGFMLQFFVGKRTSGCSNISTIM